jgi:hypothetical protein
VTLVLRAALLVLLLLGFVPASETAFAETASADAARAFDIPPLPLEDALYAFGAATGIEVYADGATLAGKRSTAVKGELAPDRALREMLVGTGLDARMMGPRAITIVTRRDDSGLYRRYSAVLQQSALRRLCAEGGAGLGTYRIAAAIWLDSGGHVQRLELLSSTGDPVRDRIVHDRLMGIAAGDIPPALPQPVVMVILPRDVAGRTGCGNG